jgi:hypothetical protein
MRLAFPRRRAAYRLAPRFRFHFVTRGAGFFVDQQLQLPVAERFAFRTQLLIRRCRNSSRSGLDFQLRPV